MQVGNLDQTPYTIFTARNDFVEKEIRKLSNLPFLPRDAMCKRGLCCRPVSVRMSVTLVDCIQTAEDIVKLYVRPSSAIILFFDPQRRYLIPGNPFSGGAKYRGSKNLRFSTEIAVYLGNGAR